MKKTKDDGVSNVVGEILLLAIAVVLVSVFAVSFFGLLPGERAEVIEFEDIDPYSGDLKTWDPDTKSAEGLIGAFFQEKWGDFISASDLNFIVYVDDSTTPLNIDQKGVFDNISGTWISRQALDMGSYAVVWFEKPAPGIYEFTFVITGPGGILEEKKYPRVVIT